MSQAEPARPYSSQKTVTNSTAGLDQPPRRQRGLTEERHAVGIAQPRRLAAEVEGRADLLGTDQRLGHLPVTVEAAAGRGPVELATRLIELARRGCCGC